MVGALPYAEVARARVAGTEPILRLEELLAAWPHVRVNIDPKSDGAVLPLIETIHRADALDRVCVGSFSGPRLALIRAALGPGLCTSLGPDGVRALRLLSWSGRLGGRVTAGLRERVTRERAACVQVPVRAGAVPVVDRAFVRSAHALGLAVHAWTVNEAAEMSRLLDLGVDGVMTDRPAVLREVLEGRGQWHATATMPR